MSEVVCKGCRALRSNCGKCSRCYEEVQSELECFKAVLAGMEFNNVDALPAEGVAFCSELGKEAARITMGLQSELSALREELVKAKEEIAVLVDDNFFHQTDCRRVKRELTAAEQRNAELVAAARNVLQAYDSGDVSDALDSLSATLAKPTESGASE